MGFYNALCDVEFIFAFCMFVARGVGGLVDSQIDQYVMHCLTDKAVEERLSPAERQYAMRYFSSFFIFIPSRAVIVCVGSKDTLLFCRAYHV
jgi:hypothetical protein